MTTWTVLSMSQTRAEQYDTKPYLFFEGDESDAISKATELGISIYGGNGGYAERQVFTHEFDTYRAALEFAFNETVEGGAIGQTYEQLNVDSNMMDVYTAAEL